MVKPIFQIKSEKQTESEGVFVLEPLEAGFGHTLGNALRRVLLTCLPGAAVTFIKITGVRHQFTTLPGLKEDIVEFILNVKKIRIKMSGDKPVKISLEATGPGEIKAGKIETPAGVEIVNKDLVLGHLADKKSKISCEMVIERGLGYSPFEERKSETLGVIPVDAIFSPVVKVNYTVGTTRVGRVANYDRLILEITADGIISPAEALKKAAQILVSYFGQIIEPKVHREEKEGKSSLSPDVLKLTVEELSLPTRITNALEKSGLKTVADLLETDKKQISSVKNLGDKSVKIIEAALKDKGVSTFDKDETSESRKAA